MRFYRSEVGRTSGSAADVLVGLLRRRAKPARRPAADQEVRPTNEVRQPLPNPAKPEPKGAIRNTGQPLPDGRGSEGFVKAEVVKKPLRRPVNIRQNTCL